MCTLNAALFFAVGGEDFIGIFGLHAMCRELLSGSSSARQSSHGGTGEDSSASSSLSGTRAWQSPLANGNYHDDGHPRRQGLPRLPAYKASHVFLRIMWLWRFSKHHQKLEFITLSV
ncbi:hypothetical protein DL546_008457 [Coniochaeta pulveracea]|uniref:Uncharacterized protein n=1 Tax=Coniochaeta pulveracea TaxID=177199 RepID=A0A420YH99_9PEZI|nr:hypothetical protein DL546_008457 [Coniochaeta pulveracea]